MEETDIIVVGAGPGGAAAAARLAAQGLRVLVLEAGGAAGWRGAAPAHRPAPRAPAVWSWGTDPQAGLDGRRVFHPAGRALGGSSAIGWSVAWPGEPEAFDGWAADGLTGWGWNDVRPCYAEVARDRPAAPAATDPATRAFLAAARGSGEPVLRDLAAPDARGAGPVRLDLLGGERRDAARTWLAPAIRCGGVQVIRHALAERVLFEGGRSWGVRYRAAGETRTVRARAGVVLAAGAIGTPLLLMRSGVGPTRELIGWGIPVIARAPHVGDGLVEGVSVPITFAAATPFGAAPCASLFARLAWLAARRGPLAQPPVTAALLLRAARTAAA